ncbi:hypothetical protein [Haliscomenobacter sp.]|uniref:hypothetical protein n=1 Tax=Haliscomenobacter sp. TaxID=2717303 RepID=UPI0035936CFB
MKKSKTFVFPAAASLAVALLLLVFTPSCKKEAAAQADQDSLSQGCDFQYGVNGYIVQEDGILNFQNATTFSAFVDTVPTWSDSAFVVWETSIGANTAYGTTSKRITP